MAKQILNFILAIGATAFLLVGIMAFVAILTMPTMSNDQFLNALAIIAASICGIAAFTKIAVSLDI